MRVMIVGLGSMGRRRARLLRHVEPGIVAIGVDFAADRRDQALSEGLDAVYPDIATALSETQPDAAFVCTSPLSHRDIIDICLENHLHVFTELNLVSDGYRALMEKARSQNRVLFLSSTLLYRRDLDYIIRTVQGKPVNYIYHVGQYLPDWHPWESYKNYFVHDIRTNGCREIFAIDLPWLLRAMGKVDDMNVMRDKMSRLEIDHPDNFMVSLHHSSGSKGLLCVDVVSRKPVRRLEVFSEDLHIDWSGTPDSLTEYDIGTHETRRVQTYGQVEHDGNYSANIIENAYLDEIYTFFSVVRGEGTPRYDFADDMQTLALIDRIEGGLA